MVRGRILFISLNGALPQIWSKKMKKLILSAAVLLMATPAFADPGTTVTGTVQLDGERACECVLDFGAGSSGTNVFVDFGDLDRTGGLTSTAPSVTGASLFCNLPSEVTITSTNGYLALNTTNAGYMAADETSSDFSVSAAPGFTGGLDYTAEVVGVTPAVSTALIDGGAAGAAVFSNVPPQNISAVDVNFNTVPNSDPLIAGDYSDQITITITPSAI